MSMIYDDCIPYFINGGGFYMVGKVKAYVDGYLKKDCQLCKWQAEDWHGNRFCKLYKKCGNPKNCSDNNVLNCSMFRADMDIINNAVADFNENIEKTKWMYGKSINFKLVRVILLNIIVNVIFPFVVLVIFLKIYNKKASAYLHFLIYIFTFAII